MSFWDNNKEGIFKGMETTGKYAWSGAKTVGKAGYSAAKGKAMNSNSTSDNTQETVKGEVHLPPPVDPKSFAPPPLKPGQLQYTSEKNKRPTPTQGQSSASINTLAPPSVPSRVPSYQQAPSPSPSPSTTPQTSAQPPVNAPLANAPPAQQEPLQQLDYDNPYYQGAVSVAETLQSTLSSSTTTSAPPPLAPRTYTRPAIAAPDAHDAVPSPDLSNLPVPPKPTIIQPVQTITITQPPQMEEPVHVQPETIQPTATRQPPPLIQRRTVQEIPTTSTSTSPVPLPPPSQSTKVATTGETTEEPETPAHKGISGSYDYKVDVKFAPPPSHKDVKRNTGHPAPLTKSKSYASSSNTIPVAPPRSSLNAVPLVASPPRSLTNARASPPPPPRRTGSSITSSEPIVNFPPPPKPTRVGEHHHPSGQHIHPESHEHEHHPPPAYTSTPGTPIVQSPSAINQPSPNINQFAPPPKPFRKHNEEPVLPITSLPLPNIVTEITEPQVEISQLQIEERPKPKPPVLKPKPTIDIEQVVLKKTPPPLKPKPSFDESKLTLNSKPGPPPPVKPKPESLKGKIPPPVKPKPSISSLNKSKPQPPSLKPKPSDFKLSNTNNSETPKKETDEIESGVVYDEAGDENPFQRYLKAAVPEEGDRFHRH